MWLMSANVSWNTSNCRAMFCGLRNVCNNCIERFSDSEMDAHVEQDFSTQLDFGDNNRAPKHVRGSAAVILAGHKVAVTPVFDAYWQFAAERQEIFFRRLRRANTALTTDPVLNVFKFTNTYRASDRVSQYLIRNVIYRDDLPSDEVNLVFRVLLFKLFNKIETWEHLEQKLGPLTWESYRYTDYDDVLSSRRAAGERIYSAAYIMPSGGSSFGHSFKHQNHLRLLEFVAKGDYPARLSACHSMADAFALLRSIPTLGPFLAYQYATDLNYSTVTDFSESDFVVAGPGALDGIEKSFVGGKSLSAADVIRYMCDNQERHFEELGIDFKTLWGRRLQLIDCQNIFCEISKYARVAFPQISGSAGRTRIKQKYAQRGELPAPWYPPKWKINDSITV
jgi:hypothetical protein